MVKSNEANQIINAMVKTVPVKPLIHSILQPVQVKPLISTVLKDSRERTMLFTKMSTAYNILMTIAKIAVGIFSLSFFMIINAFYSAGIGLAKVVSVMGFYGSRKEPDESHPHGYGREEYYCYYFIGIILLIASIIYMIYSVRMFYGHSTAQYSMNVALAIATVTFTEIVLAIRGIVVTRRDKEPIMQALKLANLASSLISLVLTQTAILSFTEEGDHSFYIGLTGMLFGGISAIIGLYMIINMTRILGGKHHKSVLKKANRITKKFDPDLYMEAVRFEDHGPNARLLYVCTKKRRTGKRYKKAIAEIESRMQVNVIREAS